ncbi:MAG: nicotinate (nicotinamide) nucleotide adenylyltransferase [Oscillospiraceae bacterium]|nr:nicotinate (nicotinamide) nucleotide adenylyltransferase [Oscillospiraceae bacterium]
MKIGVFGGTFNPVHNGHIRLAKLYFEKLGLDRLIVIPTNIPPHKTVSDMIDSADRLNMLRLAFENYPNVEISDIELNMSGKSYTVNTISALNKLYPNDELYLIVGGDMFLCFESWREYKKILSMCTLCTAPREIGEFNALKEYQKKIDPENDTTVILDAEVLVLSSSEIRQKIKNGADLNDLLPEKVLEYINQKGLYKND